MPQPSGQVLVDSGHALAGTLFAYAHDNGGGGGLWDATNGAMLTKVGTGAVATEGGATVVTSASNTHYTLASNIVITNAQAFSVGFRCRATANDAKTMVMGLTTATNSYVWLNHQTTGGQVRISSGTNWAPSGGVTAMTTWWITKGAGTSTGRVYKDGVLIGTLANAVAALTINAILKGYNTTAFDFHGSLEFAHILSGVELTGSQVESLTADPYQVLQASSGTDATASGATVAATTALLTGAASGESAGSAAGVTLTASASLLPGSASGGAGSTIALTAPAAYRMHQRNVATNTASVTISGTYTGSPGSIEYRFAGGAWATLVASPVGGTFSQAVTLPTGQGDLEVRFSSDTGVIASRALVGVGDVYIVAGQSNHVGAASQTVQPAPGAFTAVQLDTATMQWKPLQEGLTQATNFSGQSGYGGSYIGALSNRLQANGVPVAFIPVAKGSTRIDQWQRYDPDPTNPYWNYGGMLGKWNAAGGGRAMLWWQGEADASNGTAAATFESLTNDMINDWMADTGTPVFMVKITTFNAAATTIRASQDAIAAGNTNVIGIADGGGAYSGDVHYLTSAQINSVADAIYPEFVDAFYAASATASGATLTATASLQAGAASGMGSASAPGITLDAVAQLLAGIASGGSATTAGGVTLTASAAMLAGSASGQRSATASGAAWSVLASLMAGSASNGSIVWPVEPAGSTHRAIVSFYGVRAIVTAETIE